MGLDQYLYCKKTFSSLYDTEENIKQFYGLVDFMDVKDFIYPLSFCDIRFQVYYWRKSNQIHNFFIQRCGNGVDECQNIYVSREDLENLITLCDVVYNNREKAEELLPTKSGFLFGETSYGDYYFEDLKATSNALKDLLHKTPDSWEFEYQSSW